MPHPREGEPLVRIAVVGAGIAGVGAAWLLSPENTVDVYEAAPTLGGHAATIDVTVGGSTFPADAGFQVFNTRTYPNLIRFFDVLGIEWLETDMSFSVQVASENVEWSGTSLNTVFAQRGNIVNPRFLSMLADIVRFSLDADRLLADPTIDDITLAELVEREGYSATFADWYLIPMGSAIWSTPPDMLRGYPAGTFLRFCNNHGLLHITGKPMWRSVINGSRTYVEAAARDFSGEVFADEPVRSIERIEGGGVSVATDNRALVYDAVVLATHAPDSLAMLADASPLEREILGAFTFQCNEIALHTDESFMPSLAPGVGVVELVRRDDRRDKDRCSCSPTGSTTCSRCRTARLRSSRRSTRHKPYAEGSVLERVDFEHPLFSAEAVAAQKRLAEIQGAGGVWYAGAWQRYGFHEDGLLSAVRVAEALGATLPWGDELDESRTRELGRRGRAQVPGDRAARRSPRRAGVVVNSRLYTGFVAHARTRPKVNAFRYNVYFLYLDLAELDELDASLAKFAHNGTRARALPRRRSRTARRLAAAPVDRRAARRPRHRPRGRARLRAHASRACSASGSTRCRSGTASTRTARRVPCSPRSTTPSAATTTTCCTTTARRFDWDFPADRREGLLRVAVHRDGCSLRVRVLRARRRPERHARVTSWQARCCSPRACSSRPSRSPTKPSRE